jgi:HD-like signal output (HDOD) protein
MMLLTKRPERSSTYGQGIVELTETDLLDQQQIEVSLLDRLSAPDYQPPVLPSVALQLISLSRKASVAMRDIAVLLEKDPVLTAATLRIAQSPMYRGNTPIRTIDEALVRLGIQRASDLFLRAAFEARLFRSANGSEKAFERLRRHSVATAEMSRIVCRQTSLFDDSAFLCGLLHDVGIAGCLLSMGGGSKNSLSFETLWPSIRAVHIRFALRIAVLWDLPAEFQLVLAHHLAFGRTNPVHPLAAVTYLAEHLANQADCGFADEHPGTDIDRALVTLSLTSRQLDDLTKTAKDICSAVT